MVKIDPPKKHQVFFCCMIATFTTDILNSSFHGFKYKAKLSIQVLAQSDSQSPDTFMLLNAAYFSMQFIHNFEQYIDIYNDYLVKYIMCAMVSRVHMKFYILTKGYIVPGNHGTHDKLNQIPLFDSQQIKTLLLLNSDVPQKIFS